MIEIGLMILKVIGWILLGVLGLLIGVLLLVLFVPVRYRFAVSKYETVRGQIRITWLLHMFSAAFTYEEEFHTDIRFFGRNLFREEEEPADAKESIEQGTRETLEHAGRVIEDPKSISETKETVVQETEVEKQTTDRIPIYRKIANKVTVFLKKTKQNMTSVWQKWQDIRSFFENEANQATLKLIWRQIRKILHHLRPVKLQGKVMFGFDDPYTTGQVLSAAAVAYPWYGRSIQIIPCFEDEILEGELQGQGRICLGVLLYQGIRILLDRNFRKLLKQWRRKGGVQYG